MRFVYVILILLGIYVAMTCLFPQADITKNFSLNTDTWSLNKSAFQNKNRDKIVEKIEKFEATLNDVNANPEIKHEFITMIKDKFIDLDYDFNPADQPVTTRYIAIDDQEFVLFFRDTVRRQAKQWGKDIEVVDVRPIMIRETLRDFLLESIVKYRYKNNVFDVQVKHYGIRNRPDNVFDFKDTYTFQLIDIRPYLETKPPNPSLSYYNSVNLQAVNFMEDRKKVHESEKSCK